MAGLLTGNFLQLGVARPVGGVLLPIGLLLLLLAAGAALSLRGSSRKVRGGIGALGLLLVILGAWSLLTKPALMITGLTAFPQQKVLARGESCPATIDVLAVVRAKGGPGRVGLELSFFGGGKTVATAPEFEQSEKASRQTFGPYKVALPRNPPRSGAPLLLRVTSPTQTSHASLVANAGCLPRR
ncbi:MAG: hypothetical protein M3Z33_03310 [Actinomycetota bacterium]|nr:hypothetical protein [Actinomycetota bacterium]